MAKARRYPVSAALVAAVLLTTAGCTGAGSASSAQPPSSQPLPAAPTSAQATSPGQYSKVLVIAEENKSYDEVMGSGSAPYLKQLAARYATAVSMDAGYPTDCPSLGAYLLMTSGQRAGICDDDDPSAHQLSVPNIFSQVAASGRQWRGYAESMPGPCHKTNSGNYLVRHAPVPYYTSEAARCPKWDIPLGSTAAGALHDDLAAGTLPAYAFVTPNACNDMHGGDGCADAQIATGDAWLVRWMPKILAGKDYQAGRLIVVITWDEGSSTDNHIPTLLIAPTANRLTVRQPMTHCSILRLTEETLSLPLLGCAATAASPRAAFNVG